MTTSTNRAAICADLTELVGSLAKIDANGGSSQTRAKTVMTIVKAIADSPFSLMADIGEQCKREKNRCIITELMLA